MADDLLLALLAASGLLTINIMPALVTGLQIGLGFSARQAGLIGAINGYGAVAGALIAALVGMRRPARHRILLMLALMATIDLVSGAVPNFSGLCALRFAQGCVGGVITGSAFALIARRPVPERVFGLLLFVQFTLGGLGVALLPGLIERLGMPVLFRILAAIAFGILALSWRATTVSGTATIVAPHGPAGPTRPAWWIAALASLFLFQAAHMALSAYVLDIGKHTGLALNLVSLTAGLAGACGALGSLIAAAIGLRLGRSWPLAISMGLAFVAGAILVRADVVAVFVVSALLGSISWTFALSYLLGLCASADASGSGGAWSSFVSKLGLATGPLVAAFSVGEPDNPNRFLALIALALALNAAAWIAAVTAAARAPRNSTAPV